MAEMQDRRQSFQTIAWFRDLHRRDLLDLDPPYQRRSVWNLQYQQFFIETILLHYPAPAIFVHESISSDGIARYSVVDGKQRLTTIFDFTDGLIPIADDSVLTNLAGKFFAQLDDSTKKTLWSYQFSVEYLPTTDESTLTSIFDRINRNVAKLTRQELRHARYSGDFAQSAELLNEELGETLNGIPNIAPASRRQMKDVEFTAQLLLLTELGPQSFSQDDLDTAYSDRDVTWEDRVRVERAFRAAVRELEKLFAQDTLNQLPLRRLRNQVDFYSLFGVYLALISAKRLPDATTVAERLGPFFEHVSTEEGRNTSHQAASYYSAARSATSDLRQRLTRISTLSEVIRGPQE